MLIHTPRLRLITMELVHLSAIIRDPVSLGDVLGVAIPDRWPSHPAAFPHALALLEKEPRRAASGWWLYLFVDARQRMLAGCGGFREAPDSKGVVEIGCEIVPSLRRQGYATEALNGLINYACTRPAVDAIEAYSTARRSGQSRLLQAVGMTRVGDTLDSPTGKVWHWRIACEAFVESRRARTV